MMSGFKFGLILGLFPMLGLVSAGAQTTNSPSVTLDEISRALGGAKTVFSHFVQERHLSLFNEPLRSEGFLCFEQPERIRWETTTPYKAILISDGSAVSQFEWVDEKWKKLDTGMGAAMQNIVGQIAGVMKGQYARESREYEVGLAQAAAGPVITLTPRNEKMRKMMEAIEVHLYASLKETREVVLREKNGDFTRILFNKQVVNPKFPEQTFERKAPLALEKIQEAVKQAGS